MFAECLSNYMKHNTPVAFRPTAVWTAIVVVLFSGACRRDPRASAKAYVVSGDRFVTAGKFVEAAIEYRNAVQRDPTAGDVRLKLAEAILTSGDLRIALPEYVRAADLLPGDVELQVKTGNLL